MAIGPTTRSATSLRQRKLRQLELPETVDIPDRGDLPQPVLLALESGIGHEREYIRFWKRLAED